ncbi:MAG: hypothetical protein ABS35_02800 [Kaistia sp. SCN 65-12]|nr:MAG: hypothetical protein ABS35_02800 [Kaistia sp. SCN 65-12]
MAAAGIVMADHMRQAEIAQRARMGKRRGGVLGLEADAERRDRAARFAEPQHDFAAALRGRRARSPRHRHRDLLVDRLARLDPVGPRQRQRPDIGLVGRVGPVALILHLESVAFEQARHALPARRAMRDLANIHHRLYRVDGFGKARLDPVPVGMGDGGRRAAHPLDRMQHDEPGPVGEQPGRRGPATGKVQHAGLPFNLDRVVEGLAHAGDTRAIADAKAVPFLRHGQVGDDGNEGRPILVAHHEGDGADDFLAMHPDVTQVGAVEQDGERPGPQQPLRGGRLLGAVEADGTGRLAGVRSLVPRHGAISR